MKKTIKLICYLDYWLPVIVYCLIIFYISARPVTLKVISIQHLDKVIHLFEYAILSALVARALYRSPTQLRGKQIAGIAILLTVIYGISDEIHQTFVPLRDGDVWDVIFDSFGAFLGQKGYLGVAHK